MTNQNSFNKVEVAALIFGVSLLFSLNVPEISETDALLEDASLKVGERLL